MQQSTNSLLSLWPLRLILIVWGMFVALDYLFHHPYYIKALIEFRYWPLLFLLMLLLVSSWFFLFRLSAEKNKKIGFKINGLSLYLLFLTLMLLVYGYYAGVNNLFTGNPFGHLAYFVGHTLMLHSFVFVLLIVATLIGSSLLKKLKSYYSPASFYFIGLAFGVSVIGMVAVLLGLFNLLQSFVLWLLLGVGVVLCYKDVLPFLRGLFLMPVSFRMGWQGLMMAAVLVIFITINAVGSIKNFPVGFDGANLYLNTSKLINGYHGLPEGGQAFNWSVIMSLGDLLFGKTAVSILLAHLAGILCLAAVYRIALLFMHSGMALLAAAIFYVAPYITFHNIRDEKVDLGFLFISLSALLLLLEFHFRKTKKEKPDVGATVLSLGKLNIAASFLVWILAGWLTGFAFGIKYIGILNFIALMAYLAYAKGGKLAFAGMVSLGLGAIFLFRVDRFAGLDLGTTSPLLIAGFAFMSGLLLFLYSLKKQAANIKKMLMPGLLFGLFFFLAYSPWAVKHLSEHKTFSVSSIIEGKSPKPIIKVNPDYLSHLDEPIFQNQQKRKVKKHSERKEEAYAKLVKGEQEQAQNQEQKKELTAGEQVRREELHRYLGFEKGLPLYMSLPYDLTMNTNFPGHIYLDIGFLFLLLMPLILIAYGEKMTWRNVTLFLFFLILMVTSLQAVYGGSEGLQKAAALTQIDNLISGNPSGFASGFGALYKGLMGILFGLSSLFSGLFSFMSGMNILVILIVFALLLALLYWIAAEKIKDMPKGLKALSGFILSFLFFWLILGNGIPWYGFPALSLLPVLLVYYLSKPQQILGKSHKKFATYFFGIGIGLYLGMNLISHFHDHNNGANAHIFLKTPFVKYAGEPLNKRKVMALFNPFYPSATKIVNDDLEAKIYRVGTYIGYHIKNNDRRIYEDNQLGLFDEISSKVSHPGYFIQTLKENGFGYIIYDLRTAAIDKTPEKSLTRKNKEFVHQLLNSGQVELLVTDRIVKDPTGNTLEVRGFTFPGKAGLIGDAVYQGSFALFKIK